MSDAGFSGSYFPSAYYLGNYCYGHCPQFQNQSKNYVKTADLVVALFAGQRINTEHEIKNAIHLRLRDEDFDDGTLQKIEKQLYVILKGSTKHIQELLLKDFSKKGFTQVTDIKDLKGLAGSFVEYQTNLHKKRDTLDERRIGNFCTFTPIAVGYINKPGKYDGLPSCLMEHVLKKEDPKQDSSFRFFNSSLSRGFLAVRVLTNPEVNSIWKKTVSEEIKSFRDKTPDEMCQLLEGHGKNACCTIL